VTRGESQDSQHDPSSASISSLVNRHVILTITGGIAAYKSCFLARGLVQAGCELQIVMTESAARFVTPLTFATLSGNPVLTDMFPNPPPEKPIHLSTANRGELLVIAPATANFIGKMANGIADDLASTIALTFRKQVLVAPAMNPQMWIAPAVQDNINRLRDRDVEIIGPVSGEMGGVGETPGLGRMAEPDAVFSRIEELLSGQEWKDRRVLVTSGPTREAIDPVRFISNRSSGRMGDTVARRARLRGADVTLIRGRGATGSPPDGVNVVEVETTCEMSEAVKSRFENCDLLIMAAAVADWTMAEPAKSKLKKRNGEPVFNLVKTEDILTWACDHRNGQVVVGFALETENHIEQARLKLEQKGADIIALNDPTRKDSAFGGDSIKLTILSGGDRIIELPALPKNEAADRLLDSIQPLFPTR